MTRWMIALLLLAGLGLPSAWGGIIGPDVFGYSLFPNTDPGGAPYSYIDISGTGSNLGLSDDSSGGPINMAGAFSFYGNSYTNVYASSNGFISFGSGSSTLTNQNLPNANTPNNLIAVAWDDLNPSGVNNVYWQTFGSSPHPSFTGPVTVIQWANVPYFSGGGSVNAEVLLIHNTGQFLMQFNNVGQGGSGSTTGMENSDGTVGLTYAYNAASSLTSGLTILGTLPQEPGGEGIPGPSSLLLLGSGLAVVALRVRARRR